MQVAAVQMRLAAKRRVCEEAIAALIAEYDGRLAAQGQDNKALSEQSVRLAQGIGAPDTTAMGW